MNLKRLMYFYMLAYVSACESDEECSKYKACRPYGPNGSDVCSPTGEGREFLIAICVAATTLGIICLGSVACVCRRFYRIYTGQFVYPDESESEAGNSEAGSEVIEMNEAAGVEEAEEEGLEEVDIEARAEPSTSSLTL